MILLKLTFLLNIFEIQFKFLNLIINISRIIVKLTLCFTCSKKSNINLIVIF